MTYVVAELSKIQEMGFKKYFVAAALIAASAGVSAAPSLLQPERLRVEHMETRRGGYACAAYVVGECPVVGIGEKCRAESLSPCSGLIE